MTSPLIANMHTSDTNMRESVPAVSPCTVAVTNSGKLA
jgi:hypothetical protein